SVGGAVALSPSPVQLSAAAQTATLLNTVPSAVAELVASGSIPASVRVVNVAGEPLRRSLVQEVYARTEAKAVYNLYGPSEYTTYATWALVGQAAQGEPTIGRPLTNARTYVLDE